MRMRRVQATVDLKVDVSIGTQVTNRQRDNAGTQDIERRFERFGSDERTVSVRSLG